MPINLQGNALSTFSAHIRSENDGGGTSGQGQVVGYQYGQWTPNYGSTGDEASFTFTTQEGAWYRIGQSVTCHFTISIDTVPTAGTGNVRVLGFPYESDTRANGGRGLGACYSDSWDNNNPDHLLMTGESTEARLYIRGNTGNSLSLQTANMTAGCSVYATITYQTDDTTWAPSNSASVAS